jgi:hypothetical protein
MGNTNEGAVEKMSATIGRGTVHEVAVWVAVNWVKTVKELAQLKSEGHKIENNPNTLLNEVIDAAVCNFYKNPEKYTRRQQVLLEKESKDILFQTYGISWKW